LSRTIFDFLDKIFVEKGSKITCPFENDRHYKLLHSHIVGNNLEMKFEITSFITKEIGTFFSPTTFCLQSGCLKLSTAYIKTNEHIFAVKDCSIDKNEAYKCNNPIPFDCNEIYSKRDLKFCNFEETTPVFLQNSLTGRLREINFPIRC